jgi:predicted flap endonuclease-1-like 5' DNA nuclease
MTKLSEIEGLDESMEQKLKSIGITTEEELVAASATSKERAELSKKIDVAEKVILKWANRADLARVKGIGMEFADLLEAAGVDTVPELAQRKAENLLIKLTEVNAEYKFVKRLPTEKQLEDWIAQAKNLPRVLHY